MSSGPSPSVMIGRFTAFRRVSEVTEAGGIESVREVELRGFMGSIQSAQPQRTGIESGVPRTLVTHYIFTSVNASFLKAEDVVKDLKTGLYYTVSDVKDEAGMGRLWRIDTWHK